MTVDRCLKNVKVNLIYFFRKVYNVATSQGCDAYYMSKFEYFSIMIFRKIFADKCSKLILKLDFFKMKIAILLKTIPIRQRNWEDIF